MGFRESTRGSAWHHKPGPANDSLSDQGGEVMIATDGRITVDGVRFQLTEHFKSQEVHVEVRVPRMTGHHQSIHPIPPSVLAMSPMRLT